MTFHDVRFPTAMSRGSIGGPERRTEIVTLASGHEERNTAWQQARRHFDAGTGLQSLDDIDAVIAFYEARMGPLYGFRWKDWSDYRSALASQPVRSTDQLLGFGDEARTDFQLIKTYRSGFHESVRPITKPVAGTVIVSESGEKRIEGVDWTLDLATGVVTFAHPPDHGAEIRAGFEFDVPVRFGSERLDISISAYQAGEVPSVPIVEIRL